jgi:hypothetical protein
MKGVAMPAIQIDFDELHPRAPLELRAELVEHLPAAEVASLLIARFRAFVERGCDFQLALWLAVRPGDPDASPWTTAVRASSTDFALQ